ncbi:DNRLRE domain-containing protein [Nocardioides marmoraquaticus]
MRATNSSSLLSRAALLSALFAVAFAGSPVIAEAAEPESEQAAEEATAEVDERPDAVSAMTTARVTKRRVEDVSQRTETTQTFAEPDGSWTTEEATGPVRAQDPESGEWAPIDPALETVDGGIAPASAVGGLVLSDGGDKTFARMEVDGRELEWRWPTTLPTPSVEGDTATYADVVENGDLVVTATASGFQHDIVLREAPSDPVSFSIPVVTGGGPKVREDAETGSLAVRTGDGTELVTAPQPVMYDAAVDELGDPATLQPVDAAITQTPSGSVLKLSPAADFLTDPETEYPVVIDPSWSATPNGDAWVQQDAPNTNYQTSQELRVGTRNGGANRFRSFVRFAIGGAPWKGAKITSASLVLRNFETDTCNGGAIRIHRLTEQFSATSVTWNNQPTVTSFGADDTSVAKGYSGCAAGDVSWDATYITQIWADNVADPFGFRVSAVSETNNNTWRKYRSANAPDLKPRLVVNYTRYPNTPTGLTMTPSLNEFVGSTTPKLSANVSDADGGTVRARFDFYKASAPGVLDFSVDGSTVSSGGTSTATVPAGKLANGAGYTVKAYANDGVVASGKNATSGGFVERAFTVDDSVPSAIVTSTGYSNGQWATTKPASNTFTLDGDLSTRSFNVTQDDQSTVVTADSNGDATLSWNPEIGAHQLTVAPVSRAGAAGNPVAFGFGSGGTSAITRPAEGDRSSSTFPVEASGPAGATSAKVQWRFAPDTTGTPDPNAGWADATGVTLANGSNWSGSVSGTGTSATPGLIWDAAAESGISSTALVEVRVVFTYPGSTKPSPLRRITVVPHAFGGSFPTDEAGPGQVALFTGELELSEADVSVPGYGGDLSLGRSHLSMAGTPSGPAGVFGPGWKAGLAGPDEGVASLIVTDHTASDGSIVFNAPDGASYTYRHTSGTAGAQQTGSYVGVGETALDNDRLSLSIATEPGLTHRLTLTENDGGKTVWIRTTGGNGVDPT